MGLLRDVVVKRLAEPGRYSDGGGLHLLVRAPSKPELPPRRSWVLRYQLAGKRRDLGMGDYPGVSLAQARERAEAARALIKRGLDPMAERDRTTTERADAEARAEAEAAKAAERAKAEAARSFRAAAETMIADRGAGWRNPKHRAQWTATLAAYAYPILGDKPCSAITTDDVLAVLRQDSGTPPAPLWTRAPETASRLRGRIEAVLAWATARGWRTGANPATWRGHLQAMLPAPRKVAPVEHQPALPWSRMGDFWPALAERQGMAAAALRFVILTAARSGEVRGMTWGEVDLDAAVWHVPGRRMKSGRAHRVALSRAALDLLATMRPTEGEPAPGALVFPGSALDASGNPKPLSDMALSMLVRGMCSDGLPEGAPPRWADAEGRAVVVHGFRSTFRDWAGETRPEPREVVERALAHTVRDKVEAAYARADLLDRRRPLMEAWGEHVTRKPGEVVRLADRRAEGRG